MQACLEANDLWEAVEEDYVIPPLPANPTIAQIKNHKENKQRKSKAKAALLTGVSPAIFTRIMMFTSAKQIWDFLTKEYEGNEKIKGMRVMNLVREFELQKMKESETIKEYSDKLLAIVNQIRMLGHTFEDSRIVQKILVTLPERYESTISSLENSKDLTVITLAELQNALQAQEQRRAMRMEGAIEGALAAKWQSSSKNKGKKRLQKGNLDQSGDRYEKHSLSCQHCGKQGHVSQRCWRRPDVKCNKCNKFGHIARFCKGKVQLQQSEVQVADQAETEEQLFVVTHLPIESKKDVWLVDSGCTQHMSSDIENFKELNHQMKSRVKVGNGQLIEVKGKGSVEVETALGPKVIQDVLYVPEINQNLLSVGQLLEKGYKVIFENRQCIIKTEDDEELFKVRMEAKSFSLNLQENVQANVARTYTNGQLWHKRLGHYNHAALLKMKRENWVEGLPILEDNLPGCESCQLGKQVRQPFNQSTWRSTRRLQLIHTDLAGPFPEPSMNGNRYYAIFVDDYTRMCWIYFLKYKSETVDIFWKFKSWVENQVNCKIQILRSDNGTEYTSGQFSKLCAEAGIEHQFTAPYSPQQNGVCERKNRTVVEMARCMMHEKNLPKEFWAEATHTAVFLLNRLPTRAVEGKTPFECWYGFKPLLSKLRIFGSLCYVHVPQARCDKLDKRAEPGIFVGYSTVSKAYRIYNPNARKVVVSRDVWFEEEQQWDWKDSNSQQALGQMIKSTRLHDDVDDIPIRGTRSLSEVYERCTLAITEPSTFEEAKGDSNWIEAMREELRMIEKNKTWKLVSRPQQQKVIGVKWIYKTKLNPDGSINKHKARLVVKGYAQVYGVDFTETFAPVARLDTIRFLFALAATKGWFVYQLDVKSAFLNGELQEEIFIEQPEGFLVEGKEDKVYLLTKALYGLKQAPRSWNAKIDQYLQELGFRRSPSEYALYIKGSGTNILIVSIYVDDILITGSCGEQIEHFKQKMKEKFEMTDLGLMTYFLGIEIKQNADGIFIHQSKYAKEILKKFQMLECKPMKTPSAQKQKLSKCTDAVEDANYRSLVGSLMYLSNTRPDIMQAVSVLSRYLHCAGEDQMRAAKRVLRYVKGTVSFGLYFRRKDKLDFHGYSDSDWGGSDDMRSTSGYCFTLGSAVFSWCSKKQNSVAQSTAEAEFIAATAAANQVLWLRKLLSDVQETQDQATKILIDNQAAIAIANNAVFHSKTKHFNIKLYFLREEQKQGSISLVYCHTKDQIADVFTKPLAAARFEELRQKLGIAVIDSRRSVEVMNQ